MTRFHRPALACASVLAMAMLAAPSMAAPNDPPGVADAEVALPPPPTAWYADKPVGTAAGPVSAAQLAKGTDGTSWLTYGGDYRNFRHSPLTSITPATVKNLHVAWSAPTGTVGQFEASPVVYGGVMYVTTSYNRLLALDAKTGVILWRYDVQLPSDLRLCCGPANRGVAIGGDLVFMATLDGHLIAFDRTTGRVAWNEVVADYKQGYSITAAPLIVGDHVYTGVAGGEFGARGFIDAYDMKTGKRVWRTNTVPSAGEPGVETWAGDSWKSGGSPSWTTGAYDAETNTLFWTVGNPSPDWNGDTRAGDNLYSNSLLALDPATGKLKWHFQFTPHDVWDYDGNTHIFLVDTVFNGKPVKAIAQPNRNGYFYLIDRTSGKFLRASQYVEQLTWAKGVDAKGRPIVNPAAMPQENPTTRVCPSNLGGINGAWTAAFDPGTSLAFVPSIESCQQFAKGVAVHVPGIPFMGGFPNTTDANEGKSYGLLSAVDVKTGKIAWRYRDARPMMAGVATTAGGVLFTSNQQGEALAFNQATGDKLWSFRMGGVGRGQPIVYQLDGTTYVAIPSGGFTGIDSFAGAASNIPEGGQLFVFKLD
ncbi:pyrroloquinoline quinone-dependent dehydrogenase [Sandarakinorhabdus oryzae]|uniref:pyrroloquinoline quinone-dependent dehydrogenase n=1 Tax=Sandarakinorhabdus oryzae TaxID=2675220 RepID=UPI0012E0E888|nr:PQQ-dependent dehydrogenase, methanol/ethanol family [Sandarakinorhabdus oryzae]